VVSYPRFSIAPPQELVHSCLHSRDLVSTIDPLFYPMGAWEPFLPPFGPSDLESLVEYDLTICRSSIPYACDSSLIDYVGPSQNLHHHMEYSQFTSPFGNFDPPRSRDLLDIELPFDEAILESMTTVYIPWEYLHHGLCFLPFWETFQVDYRRYSWSEPTRLPNEHGLLSFKLA
jgi:hypothetical protein